jgi:hypothetical protein
MGDGHEIMTFEMRLHYKYYFSIIGNVRFFVVLPLFPECTAGPGQSERSSRG